MSNKEFVPLGAKLIFNNEYLDVVSLLCTLYCFNRRKLSLQEIIFYNSILMSDISIVVKDKTFSMDQSKSKTDIDIEFMKMDQKVFKILILLTNLEYVDIIDNNNLQFKINKKGIEIVDNLDSEYYKELVILGKYLNKQLKYNKTNVKTVIGGGI